VFDADALFPPPYYCTPTWLEILKTLGLEGTLTAELLCRCARRIEASFPCANSAPVIGKAVLLLRHMIENISRFYSQSFCAELTLIRFVPAWRASAHGRPESADAEDYSQCTLVLFSEAALPRDQYLVWTVQPILLDRAVRAPLQHSERTRRLWLTPPTHTCTGDGAHPRLICTGDGAHPRHVCTGTAGLTSLLEGPTRDDVGALEHSDTPARGHHARAPAEHHRRCPSRRHVCMLTSSRK
jgi:hypothetical protein